MARKHLFYAALPMLAASSMLTGCITEDLQKCPNDYRLRIVYDRNMLNADAFASQVHSVDIQVFDHSTGLPVCRHCESGEALASGDYTVSLPVPPGNYDILCWGGMAEGSSFSHTTPSAEALPQQGLLLNAHGGVSDKRLNDLYHGLRYNVSFFDNNNTGSLDSQIQTIRLTKDTNRVNVILMNLDGTEMRDDDFEITITSANGDMGYDNVLLPGRQITYKPWSISPIAGDITGDVSTQSAISAEFSLSRLTGDTESRLDVVRHSDGERIISVPLEDNLLLYKGEYYAYMTDDEYLNREDDYTITFILDANNNWDRAAMIYINKWATLPVQYQDF